MKKKTKAIMRAEQLLALAAYNPEGEEARSAAMALVKHIVRNGLLVVDDDFKQDPPPPRYVYCCPEEMPIPEGAERAPVRKVKRKARKNEQPEKTTATPAPAPPPPPDPVPAPKPEPPPEPKQIEDPVRQQEMVFEKPYVILVAKFGGTCMHCRKPIRANDHIAWCPGAGATHDTCAPKYAWPNRKGQNDASA